MRLGQIGCGRQNPPIQSAELASSRIGMARGMPSTSLQDWKAATAPLLPQKRRQYDAGGFPYRSARTKQPRYAPGCLYTSRWLPWLRRCAQRTQVCIKLMIIRVNLQFLYRRPNQYKRKLSEWDILILTKQYFLIQNNVQYIYIYNFIETAQTDFIETFESETRALARQCFHFQNGLNPSFMPTQQRPNRALTRQLTSFT
ncbi:Hypothetical_protein [Hexamita inflata]|uniref:Hypothetical_protein n=1 Tax=Hexamita inflata TaxID=28002 RepID=A0AA86NHP0_9EUKA|nr:Hypothetical protein HINF_LOCUS6859 [Hexamita inflata]